MKRLPPFALPVHALVSIITGEGGICDAIPEIKMAPDIIADDDETFNLLECVSSIDCAHLGMGIVGVGVLAAGTATTRSLFMIS